MKGTGGLIITHKYCFFYLTEHKVGFLTAVVLPDSLTCFTFFYICVSLCITKHVSAS